MFSARSAQNTVASSSEAPGAGRPRAHTVVAATGDAVSSWGVRRRVAAILRLACRVLGMGKRQRIGRLGGGGAAVTAALIAMGVAMAPNGAMGANYTAGGGTASGTNAISIGGAGGTASTVGANGTNAIAIGVGAAVTDAAGQTSDLSNAIAIGAGSLAQSNDTVVIGHNAQALSLSTTQAAIGETAIGSGAVTNYEYSTAIGYQATATNNQSVALGYGAQAQNGSVTNAGNIAIGAHALSQGDGSDTVNLSSAIAIGSNASAKADGGVALGEGANANYHYSTSLGSYSTAGGLGAVALGGNATASTTGAIAIGGATNATGALTGFASSSGANSIAIGTSAASSSASAIALGIGALANTGAGATALGAQAQATAANALALGSGGTGTAATAVTASVAGATAIGGNATAGAQAKSANAIAIGGQSSVAAASTGGIAIGQLAGASVGVGALAIGSNGTVGALAQNTDAVAIGSGGATAATATLASGLSSTAIGGNATAGAQALGSNSIAVGGQSSVAAASTGGIAIGQLAGASVGVGALAIGSNGTVGALAQNTDAVAIGAGGATAATATLATGTGAIALGGNATAGAKASGANAIAVGGQSVATNAGDVAIGLSTTAIGTAGTGSAVAIGNGNKATGAGAVAIGDPSISNGQGAIAAGFNSIATADGTATGGAANGAIAAGNTAIAAGQGSVALGNTSKAGVSGGLGAIAIGDTAAAQIAGGVALGSNSKVTLANSVALGEGSSASATTPTTNYTTANALVAGKTFAVNQAPANGVVAIGNRQIQGVADGEVSATSTNAVNGSQLYNVATGLTTNIGNLGTNTATALGGGAAYNTTTGAWTAPSYTIGGAAYNNVGGALSAINADLTGAGVKYFHANSTLADSSATGANATAVGPTATAAGAGAFAAGGNATAGASAAGANSVALGGQSVATNAGDVALGSGSTTAAAVATTGVTINGAAYTFAGGAPTSTVSIGAAGTASRTLTNLAAGSISAASTDAINGSQLFATNQAVGTLGTNLTTLGASTATALAGGSTYTAAGGVSAPSYSVANIGAGGVVGAPNTDTNVGAAVTGLSTDVTNLANAVNGGGIKYFHANSTLADSSATGTNATAIGPTATAAGAGAFAAGGNATAGASAAGANSVAIGGQSVATNAGDVALGSGSTTAAPNATASATINGTTYSFAGATPSSVVSVGAGGSERQITNVAAGRLTAASTDAINGSQLFATNQAVGTLGTNLTTLGTTTATALGGGSSYTAAGGVSAPSYTVANITGTGSVGAPNTANSVGAAVGDLSTDVTNLANNLGSASTKYFHANSTGTDVNNATGADAVVAGINAKAAGANGVAIGGGVSGAATAWNSGGVAIGVATVAGVSGNATILNDVAIGNGANAIGGASLAFGYNAKAAGGDGVAFGDATRAYDVGGVAIGGGALSGVSGSTAIAQDTAIGYQSKAIGNASTAIGSSANASGADGTAIGASANASGSNSAAIGNGANASGPSALALGQNAGASGQNSVAIGENAGATGINAVALGGASAANGSIAVGYQATSANGSTVVGMNANSGVANNASAFGNTSSVAGDRDVAVGYKATTVGGATATTDNVALGPNTTAYGGGATALGSGSSATGANSLALGAGATATNGSDLALGYLAQASGGNSTALGGNTKASGGNATAVGSGSSANGSGSVAVGYKQTAYGAGAVALGDPSYASGAGVFTGGANNIANSDGTMSATVANATTGAVAIGNSNTAIGQGSVALGNSSTAGAAGAGGSIAIGDTASAAVNKGVALGSGATAKNANDVALGSGSVTAAPNPTASASINGTTYSFAGATPTSVVSVGAGGAERQIANVAAGRLTATSTDAVNGSQLYSTNAAVTALGTNVNALGTATASNFGGGSTFNPATGKVSAPSYTVAGGTYNDVGTALGALSTEAGLGLNFSGNSGTAFNVAPGKTLPIVGATTTTGVTTGFSTAAPTAGTYSSANVQTYANSATGQIQVQLADNPTFAGTITSSGLTQTAGSTINLGGNAVNGVAAGSLAPASTQAVNGGQINTGLTSVATSLGGGSAFNPATGQVTASLTLPTTGATNYGDVQTALNALASGASVSKYFHANSVLPDSQALGTDSVAIGPNAAANNGNDVALGAGATTAAANTGTTALYGGTAAGVAKSASGVVSVGAAGNERQINNVAAGVISATSTDAINGSQLFGVASGVNALGTTTASGLGGGSTYDPTTGKVSAPSYNVGGTAQNNVGGAIAALQTGAPLQYSTAGAPTTANGFNPSQDVTLVGQAAGPVGLHNVAAGTVSATSTDGVNGAQLFGANQNVASALGGGAGVGPNGALTAPSYTVYNPNGTTSTVSDVGSALTAINSTGIKYFHANSTSPDSQALGAGSVAIGPNAVANNAGDIALGAGSVTASANPTAGTTINGTNYSFAGATPSSVVSVGAGGAERQITNVAAGRLTATSTDAVNGSQLFSTNTAVIGLGTNVNALGTTTAANFGGGSTYDPTTGKVSAPSYNVGGAAQTNVGGAIAALQSGAPVQYSTAGAPTTPNGFAPSNNQTLVGAAAGPVTLSNVAAGSLAPASTQAVNGGQINTGLTSVATSLGGGSAFNPATGQVTASLTLPTTGATNYGDVQTALNALASGASVSKYFHANSVLPDSQALGTDSVAIGPNAAANNGNDVALGAGATTAAANTGTTALYGGTAAGVAKSASGVVSVGAAGNERQINNVAAGVISATSTDAINGSQLFGVASGVNALGTTTASGLGGGSTYDPTTGKVSAPSYNVGGTAQNNVGGAIAALQTGAPLQYSTAGAPTTANGFNPSQDVTLVGQAAGPVGLHNVAPGALLATSTDAVNGSQINAGLTSVANNFGGGASFNPATGQVTAPNYSIAGATYNDVGSALSALATGGAVSKYFHATSTLADSQALGTDSVAIGPATIASGPSAIASGAGASASGANSSAYGAGASATAASATAIGNGSSAGAASSFAAGDGSTVVAAAGAGSVAVGYKSSAASGSGAVAIGNRQTASGDGAVAIGDPNSATGTGALAIGANNTANGQGAVALGAGNGAAGQGALALGNASTAGAAGALALGDTANASAVNAIAFGSGAAAGNANDVALGAGSITAAAHTGTTALYGGTAAGVAVASSGVLSVGAAGAERQIQNVAAGVISAASTDAINGSQLFAVSSGVNALGVSTAAGLGGGSTFNPATGQVSAPSYNVAGGTQNNVGAALGALDTAAQTQGAGLANALGGGAAVAPNGTVTAPSFNVGGSTYNNVNSALGALQTGAPAQYSTAANPTTANGLNPSQDVTLVGQAAGPVGLHNLANGTVTATSTDAVNGSQLYGANQNVAAALGGGAGVAPNGALMAPSYTVYGANGAPSTVNDVGSALTAINSTGIKYFHANSTSLDSQALGAGSVAIGPNAVANNANDVALGAGSMTAAANPMAGTTINGANYAFAGATPSSVVSVGAGGAERQITNVAAGQLTGTSTDAVNGSQLFATNTALTSLGTNVNALGTTTASGLGGGSTYNPATGQVSAPAYNVAGGTQNNVGAALTALNTASQTQGTGLANALGGGAFVAPNGTVTAPGFNVGGTSYNNVNSALGALQSGAPLQYSTAAAPTTANGFNPSQNATLVGAAPGPVTLSNVAPGALTAASSDAVNGSQLYATNQNVTNLTKGTSGLVQQVGGAPGNGQITVGAATGGTSVNIAGTSGARTLTGLQPGAVSAASADAVNGSQLYAANASVAAALGGGASVGANGALTAPSFTVFNPNGTTSAVNDVGSALTAINSAGIKYFHANSTAPDSQALGAGSVAIGPNAVANNANDVALGSGSVTAAANPTAGTTINGANYAFAGATPSSVVSVGAPGAERQITNVAAGQLTAVSTDAVNGSQLYSTNTALNSLGTNVNALGATTASGLGGGSTYNPATGQVSAPTYNVAGGTQSNVGAALTALNTASQTQGTGLANALGGGASVAPNGTVTAPSFSVGGSSYNNVNQALGALQTGAPAQYSTAANPTTANGLNQSQDVTLVGSAAGPVGLHNVAAGTLSATSTDAVNGSQLYATNQSINNIANGTAGLVQQIGGAPGNGQITVGAATGGTSVNFAGIAGARTLTGVANGAVSAASSDAVNGSQIYNANASVASALGGGAGVGANGALTAPSYAVYNANGTTSTVGDVGSALTAINTVGIKYFHANSMAPDSQALGTDSLAMGPNAVAANANDVALGSGSVTGAPNVGLTALYGGTAAGVAKTASGVVSVGVAGAERQIQNVAAGVLSASSTDAVNGSQLFSVSQGVDGLGASVASNLGGGATYSPATGQVSAPSYAVGGSTYDNVGGAIGALQTSAPLQYATAANPTTANGLNPSQNVTLVGAAAGPVTLSNVAAGALNPTSTQAVNGAQLDATNQNVANLTSGIAGGSIGLVQQVGGAPSAGQITVGATTGGTSVNIAGTAGPRTLTGVAPGAVTAASTDAVNGSQLYTASNSVASALGGGAGVGANGAVTAPSYTVQGGTYDNVGGALGAVDTSLTTLNSAVNGGGIKYFHANSTGADGQALGTNSVAVGPKALANNAGDVALGSGSTTSAAVGTAGTTINGQNYGFAGAAPTSTVSVGSLGAERTLTNVAAGQLTAVSTDAVNGSQLYATNQAVNAVGAQSGQLGQTAAAALGGGTTYDPATGKLSAPSYSVGSSSYNNVGAAINGVQTGAPLQYSTAAAPTTANGYNPSQDVTLVGAAAGPVVLHNVAAGVAATDAANVAQLPGAFTSPTSNTFAFKQSGGGGAPVTLTNVASGAVAPNSTQAVNGGQLYSVAQATQSGFNNLSAMVNQGFQNLQGQISANDKRAAGGTALALAASGLRYDDRPGKYTVGAATGYYRGQFGFAAGAAHTSDDGKWRINASATFTPAATRPDFGLVGGASYSFP